MTELQINFNCLRPGVLALFPEALLLFFLFFLLHCALRSSLSPLHTATWAEEDVSRLSARTVLYIYIIFSSYQLTRCTEVALLPAGFEKHTCGQKPPSFEGQHAPSAHCQSRFSLYLGLVHTSVGIFLHFYLTFLC